MHTHVVCPDPELQTHCDACVVCPWLKIVPVKRAFSPVSVIFPINYNTHQLLAFLIKGYHMEYISELLFILKDFIIVINRTM